MLGFNSAFFILNEKLELKQKNLNTKNKAEFWSYIKSAFYNPFLKLIYKLFSFFNFLFLEWNLYSLAKVELATIPIASEIIR